MDELQKRADEIAEGKLGKKEEKKESDAPGIFEQAKLIKEETEKVLEEIKAERQKMEKALAEMALSGKSLAGGKPQIKTQEEVDKDAADKIIKRFYPK